MTCLALSLLELSEETGEEADEVEAVLEFDDDVRISTGVVCSC